ncbi:hypothetical protein ACSQ67_015858 [Phaseolus vulgaris]
MTVALTKSLPLLLFSLWTVVLTETDPNDVGILNSFRRGLKNKELLPWPEEGGDPCGNPPWKYIFCNGNRVSQIQTKNLGLVGPLPSNFNKLSMLENLGMQNNNLNGPLPSFNGLSNLKYAFLNRNGFESIPGDFFRGLRSLQVLALDYNNLNASSGGWVLPQTLEDSAQLRNFSCMSCNLVGPIPAFLGSLPSLEVLQLSGNSLTGEIPAALNAVPALQILWLNNQRGDGLTGKIEVVASMISLTSLWLHGNKFSGSIPMNIGDLVSLRDLDLNGNEFVGLIPRGLSGMKLQRLDLNNNHFMGPIPDFAADKVSFESNNFCLSKPGVMCAFEVMALLDFLGGLGYPQILVDSWSGNNPCDGPWLAIKCNGDGKVEMIILSNFNLSGTLSPSVAKLDSLVGIRLGGNDISGRIPSNWTSLRSLTLLDLSGNNISLPFPSFGKGVKLVIDAPEVSLSPPGSGSGPSPGSGSGKVEPPSSDKGNPNPSEESSPNPKPRSVSLESNNSRGKSLVLIVAPIAGVAAAAFVLIPLYVYCFRKRKGVSDRAGSLVIHPGDPSDSNIALKVVIANNNNGSVSAVTGAGSGTLNGMTGKVTTKADVFSFGVVLMELLTGLMALDEDRPEESQYLASWFWHVKSDKEKLMAAVDPALDIKEEMFDIVSIIAELAGHCTAREPYQRPDMSHAVNVLGPLVEKWKPLDDDTEEYSGIDYTLPLNQMVKDWQETEGKELSYVDPQDSKSSIPARPTGFAESFTSVDGR